MGHLTRKCNKVSFSCSLQREHVFVAFNSDFANDIRQQNKHTDQLPEQKNALRKKVCCATIMDIQSFNRFWHPGLLYKIKINFPQNPYLIIKSYLISERFFLVTNEGCFSKLYPKNDRIPQGSILEPVLYLLNTANISNEEYVTTATFADHTAILACHR